MQLPCDLPEGSATEAQVGLEFELEFEFESEIEFFSFEIEFEPRGESERSSLSSSPRSSFFRLRSSSSRVRAGVGEDHFGARQVSFPLQNGLQNVSKMDSRNVSNMTPK